MSKCNKCNVIIRDNTEVCPLCRCVIDIDKNVENKYPNILEKHEKYKLAVRIYLFCAIVLGGASIYVNYKIYDSTLWSVIVCCALAYIYLTLAYLIDYPRSGYRTKTLVATLGALTLISMIDVVTGNKMWSLNYVMPSLFLCVNVGIIVLIIVNRRHWQSYLTVQLWVVFLSGCQHIFYAVKVVTDNRLINVSIVVSIVCFLGTLIIGGRRATNELKRRFHL